jgi:hypothetical protein
VDPLLRSDPLAAAMPPAKGPLPFADPLAGAGANPLAASSAASAPAGSGPNWVLIGVGGGGAVFALMAIIAIVVANSGGGAVAENSAPGGPPISPPAQPAAPSSPSPAPSGTSSPAALSSFAATTAPVPATSSALPSATNAASSPTLPSASSNSPADASTSTALKSSGRHVLADLPAGVHAWHNGSRGKLVGIFNLKEDQNPNALLSWMTALLPHLGYQKQYDMLVRDKPITEKANLQVGVQTIPEFLNPIEGKSRWSGYPFDGLALTHFAGMSGVEDARNVCAGELPRSDPRAGIFGYDEVAKPVDIADGASQTVMIVGSGPLASPWIMGGGATIRGWREPVFDPIGGLGTRGLPGGGTVVVMADGSVRQIPANIDPQVFRAMCTMHGAETVDLTPAPAFSLEEWK